MHSILFVCTANICRSPMAMGIMQSKVKHQDDLWLIRSAGVWVMENQPAAANTIKFVREFGVDISNHQSKSINKEMIDRFNLILVMERNHKEALRSAFRNQGSKIFMLSEMIGEKYEINDPIGGSLADFNATALEVDNILTEGFPKIEQLSKALIAL